MHGLACGLVVARVCAACCPAPSTCQPPLLYTPAHRIHCPHPHQDKHQHQYSSTPPPTPTTTQGASTTLRKLLPPSLIKALHAEGCLTLLASVMADLLDQVRVLVVAPLRLSSRGGDQHRCTTPSIKQGAEEDHSHAGASISPPQPTNHTHVACRISKPAPPQGLSR